jgi:hypothetical protein
LLLIKQHITYMNISRYVNIDKFVNIRYIFLLARWTYSWLFQLAQMWKLLAPGVGLGDLLTAETATWNDVYRKLSPTQQSFSFRHSAQYSWNITDGPQWCLAVNNRWINHFVIANLENYELSFSMLKWYFLYFFRLIFVLSFPKKLFR